MVMMVQMEAMGQMVRMEQQQGLELQQ